MKFITYITILLAVLSACQPKINYPHSIQQAENCMESNPDSALALLQSISDNIHTLPEEVQMYYHLLTIQAKDKLYIPHTNDSLIKRIVAFYEVFGNEEKSMLAYYYQGSVYRDMNDAPRAIEAFRRSTKYGEKNKTLLPRVYSQMGTLFAYQGLYEEALKAHQAAMNIYQHTGETNRISFTQRDIARIFDLKECPDSAFFYYTEACKTTLQNTDSIRYYGLLGELGGFLNENGQTDTAKQLLKSVEQQTSIRNKAYIYASLGHIYKREQKIDSAYVYYKKTLEQDDIRRKYYTYKNLYQLEKDKKNYTQALMYIDKAIELKDSIDVLTQTEATAKINALYNYQHTTEENIRLKSKEEKQKILLLSLGIIFWSIFSLGVIYILHQKKEQQKKLFQEQRLREQIEHKYSISETAIQDNKQKIAELETLLVESRKANDLLTTKYLQSKQKHLEAQNEGIKLIQQERQLHLDLFKRSNLFLDFQQASQNENINLSPIVCPEKWIKLQQELDNIYPHFTEKLKGICQQLSDTELQVCWLTKIGISPSNIAKILKYSKQNISNIRSRIYKRIPNADKRFENFDHFIESF